MELIQLGYDIITDAAKGISVLIDSDGTRALGPVAYGEGGARYLEAFVGALGTDPATLPDWYIGPRWLDFVSELADATPDTESTEPDDSIAVPDIAAEFAAEPHDAPGVEAAPPVGDPLPPTGEVAAPAGDPQPTGEPVAGELAVEPEPAATAGADPNVAAPGATVACGSCNGSGTQPDGAGGVTPCAACGGDGLVAAPEAPAAASA